MASLSRAGCCAGAWPLSMPLMSYVPTVAPFMRARMVSRPAPSSAISIRSRREQLAALQDAGAQILRHPADKDETDLELALRHCRRIGASTVTIIGGLGGRLDQTVANIFLLRLPELSGLPIEHVDGDQATRLLAPGRHPVAGRPGDTISLIPITAAARGIITSGLKYPLRHETLSMGPARGISNVMLFGSKRFIEFQSGLLLLVHTMRTGLMADYSVIKCDAFGREEALLPRRPWSSAMKEFVCIDATFALPDRDLGFMFNCAGAIAFANGSISSAITISFASPPATAARSKAGTATSPVRR